MNLSELNSAMKAAKSYSSAADMIETASARKFAKELSSARQLSQYADVLSLKSMMRETMPTLATLGKSCELPDSAIDILRKKSVPDARLARTLTSDFERTLADVTGVSAAAHAGTCLARSASEAATAMRRFTDSEALIDLCRSQSIDEAVSRFEIERLIEPRDFGLLDEAPGVPDDKEIVITRPDLFDFPGRPGPRQGRVPANELSGDERSDFAHRHVVVVEKAIRRFIRRRMQAVYGEGWLAAKVSDKHRAKWKKALAKKQERAEDFHLIDFADFGIYKDLITQDDDVWSHAFESVLHEKDEVIRLLERLNRYRRDPAHSRDPSPEELVAFHHDAVRLLNLIAPEDVAKLPARTLFDVR